MRSPAWHRWRVAPREWWSVVAMVTPPRYPPRPFERASLVASYFRKADAKTLAAWILGGAK